jgi:hypothetical protein
VHELLGFLAVVGGFAVIMGGLTLLGSRIRRRGLGGAVMGPFDEIWHPAAHQSHIEVQTQEDRVTPSPSPDDRLA